MGLTSTTTDELDARTALAWDRTVSLLRTVDPRLPLQHGDWTAHDVALHLLDVLHRYTRRDFTQRAGLTDSPAELQAGNRRGIAELRRMELPEVLDRLVAERADYASLDVPLVGSYPFHAGQTIDGAGARSNWLGELLIHGRDVAVAAGRPWPIAPRDAVLVLNGVLQVAPGWLDPEAAAGVELEVALRVRGGVPQLFRIADGRCRIRDLTASDRPHAVIRAPAPAMTLLFYQRIGLAAAVRKGVLVTGGTRPWRGLRLPQLFLPA